MAHTQVCTHVRVWGVLLEHVSVSPSQFESRVLTLALPDWTVGKMPSGLRSHSSLPPDRVLVRQPQAETACAAGLSTTPETEPLLQTWQPPLFSWFSCGEARGSTPL